MRTQLRTLEGVVALLAFGLAYTFVSDRFTIGPPWLVLVILAVGSVAVGLLRWRGLVRARQLVALALLVVATAAVALSAVFLLGALLRGRAEAGDLLASAGLVWVGNVLVFSLWYWELDGGGPHRRGPGEKASSDFLFPQLVSGGSRAEDWLPDYLDYLFLAFNTSTAFSPTDTMILARRSKVLMMLQSVISLLTVAVLAARAINTL